MEAQGECKISIKLLIDNSTEPKKVLFAEAGKDFVDFLFHIMSLPVGTIVKLLNENGIVGSLGLLYKSIESLNADYFLSNLTKDSVLNPRAPVSVPLLALNDTPAATVTPNYNQKNGSIYVCCESRYDNGDCESNYFTDNQGTICPYCRSEMMDELIYLEPKPLKLMPVKKLSKLRGGRCIVEEVVTTSKNTSVSSVGAGGGYVKGVVTYTVMDNLEVKPLSTISGITLMNMFQVKDISCLEEKEVHVSLAEGVAMLKASLETSAVLTSVFLAKKI